MYDVNRSIQSWEVALFVFWFSYISTYCLLQKKLIKCRVGIVCTLFPCSSEEGLYKGCCVCNYSFTPSSVAFFYLFPINSPGNLEGSWSEIHIELYKGGKRIFANFQAKTQWFWYRFWFCINRAYLKKKLSLQVQK